MSEISSTGQKLLKAASEALENAYSPYSEFRVGAALITADGQIFSGCNIENSAYGLTICAERTAIFKAVSEGYTDFEKLAIVVESAEGIGTPCGSCRQVMLEFNPEMDVIMSNTSGEYKIYKTRDLLPRSFASKQLDEDKIPPEN